MASCPYPLIMRFINVHIIYYLSPHHSLLLKYGIKASNEGNILSSNGLITKAQRQSIPHGKATRQRRNKFFMLPSSYRGPYGWGLPDADHIFVSLQPLLRPHFSLPSNATWIIW